MRVPTIGLFESTASETSVSRIKSRSAPNGFYNRALQSAGQISSITPRRVKHRFCSTLASSGSASIVRRARCIRSPQWRYQGNTKPVAFSSLQGCCHSAASLSRIGTFPSMCYYCTVLLRTAIVSTVTAARFAENLLAWNSEWGYKESPNKITQIRSSRTVAISCVNHLSNERLLCRGFYLSFYPFVFLPDVGGVCSRFWRELDPTYTRRVENDLRSRRP